MVLHIYILRCFNIKLNIFSGFYNTIKYILIIYEYIFKIMQIKELKFIDEN